MPFAAAEKIAKSHNARGMALAAAGRYDDAAAAFEAAESYKPDFAPVIANIALACWQAGRREEAFLRAAQALAFDPANPTAKRVLQEAGR
jgi:tetratricopeptide (TPR) repeat protein